MSRKMLLPVVVSILCGGLLFIAPHKEQEQRKEQKAVVEKQDMLDPISMRCERNEDGSAFIYFSSIRGEENKNVHLVWWQYEPVTTRDTVESMILNYGNKATPWAALHEDTWWKLTPTETNERFVHGNLIMVADPPEPEVVSWRFISYGALGLLIILVCGALIWRHRRRTSSVLYLEAVRYDGPKKGDVVVDGEGRVVE